MITRTILFLAANPSNTQRLRLDEEIREIDEGLRRSKNREQFILQQKWAIRPDDLRRAMLDHEPNIVHFSGHGVGWDGIILEGRDGLAKPVTADALKGLFELFPEVECVLLSACFSEIQAEAIATTVKYVIGMSQAIGDHSAILFASGFYDALGAGRTLSAAYKFGCNALQLAGIPEQLTPILKTRLTYDELTVRPPTTQSLSRDQLKRLLAEQNRIMFYAEKQADFEVYVNSVLSPTEYIVRFLAPSLAPPPDGSTEPVFIDTHEVLIRLPFNYPLEPVKISWMTPIFHPDINPETGILHLNLPASIGLDDVCGILSAIASYCNYAPRETCTNERAAKWALSPKGQKSIPLIGGRKLQERMNVEIPNLPPRMIKLK